MNFSGEFFWEGSGLTSLRPPRAPPRAPQSKSHELCGSQLTHYCTLTMDEAAFALRILDPKAHLRAFIESSVRRDGRSFDQHRRVNLTPGPFNSFRRAGEAESSSGSSCGACCGSSIVEVGETRVACAVSLMVGTPSPSLPDCGDLEITVGLGPVCSASRYEQRGKSSDAYKLESDLLAVMNDGDVIDLAQLCIERERFAYRLCVAVTCLSDAGGLFDAALLSVVTALADTALPTPSIIAGEVCVSFAETKPLALKYRPVPITLGIFEGNYLVDPHADELGVVDVVVTSAFHPDGTVAYWTHVDRSGKGLSQTELLAAVRACGTYAATLRAALHW